MSVAFSADLSVAAGSLSGLAFGRSRSGSLWVLTGVELASCPAVLQFLSASGCSVVRLGCSLGSGRGWFAFSAADAVVLQFAVVLPVAPGSRSHRFLRSVPAAA